MRSLPRPLDPFRSFKAKVAVLVATSLVASTAAFAIANQWPFRYALLTALVVAVVITQVLARGMTSPLREMTAAARRMARGEYSTRVRATSRDEVGELALAFNQMAADLATVDAQRRELIANVSHELRTPIAALQAVLENMVDGVTPPDPHRLRTALAQTERLGRFVADLLDLSRVEGGVIPLAREEFEVAQFLDGVVAESGLERVRVEVEPVALRGRADPTRLHQVVTNLLTNAARHAPAGSWVVVRARAEAGALRLDVNDAGPGIAPEERERVFQRFTRGGADDGGTGLGLAIARWAVELHGGEIAVIGEPPGCRIRVTLPQS